MSWVMRDGTGVHLVVRDGALAGRMARELGGRHLGVSVLLRHLGGNGGC